MTRRRDRELAEIEREHRIELLVDAFDCLLNGRLPSPEASLFLGSAGDGWLTNGGRLDRDHLRVTQPSGSHLRVEVVAQRIRSSSTRNDDKRFAVVNTGSSRIHRLR